MNVRGAVFFLINEGFQVFDERKQVDFQRVGIYCPFHCLPLRKKDKNVCKGNTVCAIQ